ncbi:hypothetical protein BGX30_004061, partial [Mortierella sp. GBA39]
MRVHDSLSCISGGDAPCAKSECPLDSSDDQGCNGGSDKTCGESCDDEDQVEIGG